MVIIEYLCLKRKIKLHYGVVALATRRYGIDIQKAGISGAIHSKPEECLVRD